MSEATASSETARDDEQLSATVLVVDDEPNIVTLLETWLETIGCRVISAEDGEKGVQKATEELPDLILMDGMMPRMSGFDACRALKSQSATRDIPVIFLTVQNEVQDVVRGLDLGAHGYMTKPFKPQELLARVRSTLKIKQIQDRLRAHTRTLKTRWDWIHGAIETLPVGLMVFDRSNDEVLFTNESWNRLLGLSSGNPDASVLVTELYEFHSGSDSLNSEVLASDEPYEGEIAVRFRGSDAGRFHLQACSFERSERTGRQLLLRPL